MTVETFTSLLGWASVINIAILLITAVALLTMRQAIIRIHSRFFDLDERDLNRAYFQYLAQFKILVLLFNIVPYFALKILF